MLRRGRSVRQRWAELGSNLDSVCTCPLRRHVLHTHHVLVVSRGLRASCLSRQQRHAVPSLRLFHSAVVASSPQHVHVTLRSDDAQQPPPPLQAQSSPAPSTPQLSPPPSPAHLSDAHSYAATLLLPQSSFPLHFNAALHEPRLAAICCTALYRHQQFSPLLQRDLTSSSSPPLFLLHDGPPFANGSLHIGHFLNKTLKDIVNRYRLLTGHRIHFVNGWDCHGLPIELKALAASPSPSSLSPLDVRRTARAFALAAIAEQKAEFERWGLLTDWTESYRTLEPRYEAEQLTVFLSMLQRGLVYRALKPVYWSPATRTALAEAELEYSDDHVSPSVWVGFPVRGALEERWKGLTVAVWTTTPWTLPGNAAVAYHPDVQYVVARVGERRAQEEGSKKKERKQEDGVDGRYLLIGKDRVAAISDVLQREVAVVDSVPASALADVEVRHPFLDRASPMIAALHVTTDTGTAFVHTAPAHGADDFVACREHGIGDVVGLVDEDGRFTSAAPVPLAGLYVLKEGNSGVIALLRASSSLLSLQHVTHRYPYDWRSKTPVITRATEQWFTRLDSLQADALQATDAVHFTPEAGRARLRGMLGARKEWCLSRQRVWGVPIPVFYREDGAVLMEEDSVRWVIDLVRQHGSDVWWEKVEAELLAPRYRNDGHTYTKGQDTMDVWFDSGTSWRLGLQDIAERTQRPVEQFDVYLEGSDQHRGWFQSSLLTAVAVTGRAPYKAIVTHGFVLDEDGRKMSKSLGNIIEPKTIIQGVASSSPSALASSLSAVGQAQPKKGKKRPTSASSSTPAAPGADFLRLWVASTDYTADASIGPSVLSKVHDVYRKVRGLARFMLGCLADWQGGEECVPAQDMLGLDRYMLHVCRGFARSVTDEYEAGRYSRVYAVLVHFMNTDLSAFYFDVSKDRLYADAARSPRRRACLTVLALILESLTKAIAPILPHTAEDIYQHCPPPLQRRFNDPLGADVPIIGLNSLFTHGWLSCASSASASAQWEVDEEEVRRYEHVRRLRVEVNRLLELARHPRKREGIALDGGNAEVTVEGIDTIGTSQADVRLTVGGDSRLLHALSHLEQGELEMILGVANVTVVQVDVHGLAPLDPFMDVDGVRVRGTATVADADGKSEALHVVITPTRGVKCLRCWRYTASKRHDSLCSRCVRLLTEQLHPIPL